MAWTTSAWMAGAAMAAGLGTASCQAPPGGGAQGDLDLGPPRGSDATTSQGELDAATGANAPGAGTCLSAQEGAPCDDGNPCTDGDRCARGTCVGAVSVVCPDQGACESGFCDPQIGCTSRLADPGSLCKVPCFGLAFCETGGQCVPDPATARICEPDAGSCVESMVCKHDVCEVADYLKKDAACEADDDLCTVERCTADHQCTPREEERCAGEKTNAPCKVWKCNLGACQPQGFVTPGTSCDDGEGCTEDDKCDGVAKTCVGAPVEVDDNNPCTNDTCHEGVVEHQIQNGVVCQGSVCDPEGICQDGICVHDLCACQADKDCPVDPCQGTAYCDEGGECQFDKQSAHLCEQPANACLAALCDSTVLVGGEPTCVTKPHPDGKACNDGNYCNSLDVCKAGACVPLDLPSCDDGNLCNGVETCASGDCAPGKPLACDDDEACTVDACDPGVGCTYQGLPNGTECTDEDGDPCTVQEKCSAGVCEGKPCTASGLVCAGDGCVALVGVTFRAVGLAANLEGTGGSAEILINSTVSADLFGEGLEAVLSYLTLWLGSKE